MKKTIFAIAIAMMMNLAATAQTDGFFNNMDNFGSLDRTGFSTPNLPNIHNWYDDYEAPIGSGLLVFTMLGTGYAIRQKRHGSC